MLALAVALALALGVVLAGQAVASSPSSPAGSGSVAARGGGHHGPLVIAAAGDISSCGTVTCPAAATARLVRAIDPSLVLALGDTQYDRGTLPEFRAEYDNSWGSFRGRTRPVPGNHEYLTPRAAGYFSYFGEQAHPGNDGYYSFNARRWHFVALNSNDGLCRAVACGPGSRQLRWLKRDLRESQHTCEVAYFHHPPWSSTAAGGNRNVRPMFQALARHGADILLGGHDHNYERFARRGADGQKSRHGVRQFIVGTGGVPLNPLKELDSLSRHGIDRQHGVLRLALSRNSYRYQFVSTAGVVLDRGGPVSCT